ncbi:MAG: phosphoribosylformylglycinamidine cyclo-ligase [Alphaproteobacteria bacterium]
MTIGSRRGEDAISELTYRDAGVDIDAGARLVDRIKSHARATFRSGVLDGLGGFGGLFAPGAAGYRDPVLVAGTDGVGTKLKIAFASGLHDTVGIDLVAMCVNDVLAHGAEPLFFLDYFATGRLDVGTAERVIAGIAAGCRAAGCALLGGETAEMPGFYADGDYDLAGFAVGAVERENLLRGDETRPGDVLLGLASSGLHANGYSLVRRVVATAGTGLGDPAPFAPASTLAQALMTPTRIYVKSVLPLAQARLVHGIAHITGGGLVENVPRVLPVGTVARLDAAAWPLPAVFRWLMRGAGPQAIDAHELARTFNCGVGMVVAVPGAKAAEVAAALEGAGETVWRIGEVRPAEAGRPAAVELAGLESWHG